VNLVTTVELLDASDLELTFYMFRVSGFITLQSFNLPSVIADQGDTKHLIGGLSDENNITNMYSGFIYSYRIANYVMKDFSGHTGEE